MPSFHPPSVSSSSGTGNAPQPMTENTFHVSNFDVNKCKGHANQGLPQPHKDYEEWFRDRSHSFQKNKNCEDFYNGNSNAMPGARRSGGGNRRWSFVLQDLPTKVRQAAYDVRYGYVVRVGLVAGMTLVASYAMYAIMARLQEEKPLAQRWWLFSRPVPVTLMDKKQVDGSNMYWYRFALPNSYDYAGYEPISSVQLRTGEVGGLSSLQRWYTPISHPEERGIIEFVIKDCDPGRMSARLRNLTVGDQVYLGRWMKEFRYRPDQHTHIGMICSTGGASVALQLLHYLDRQPQFSTCLSLLYCHSSPFDIPFRRVFQDFEVRDSRFSVKFNVMSVGIEAYRNPEKALPSGLVLGKNLFTGNLSPTTIEKTMPRPVLSKKWGSGGGVGEMIGVGSTRNSAGGALVEGSATSTAAAKESLYRPPLLICGPQSMLTFLSGKVSTIGHMTYWQGPFYKYYTGFLSDLGYDRKQVYKFGVSKHFMAIQ